MTRGTPPVVLLISDGWGQAPDGPGNAISLARTPFLDRYLGDLLQTHTLIQGGGRGASGCRAGSMGNSEVGHLNLGAGRVVPMEITRASTRRSLGGRFFENPAWQRGGRHA